MNNKSVAKMDLSKPFFRMLPEVDGIISWESNSPNDQHGDQAFEYDNDGTRYAQWKAYLAELDAAGTRGDLVYQKWSMQRNEIFDGKKDVPISEYALSSYRMMLLDVSDNTDNIKMI